MTLPTQCRSQVNKNIHTALRMSQNEHAYATFTCSTKAQTHAKAYMCAHAILHTDMCKHTPTQEYAHLHRVLLTCMNLGRVLFNASLSFRLEPLPLCSYHSISLNCSGVTLMTRRLPFYLRAVCHLKAAPSESWDKSKTYD